MKKSMFKIYNPNTPAGVGCSDNSIVEYEIIKSTEKSVWLLHKNGTVQRHLKITAAYIWFDSKEEAYEYMEDKIVKQIEINYSVNSLIFYDKKLKDFYKENIDIQRDKKLKKLLS